MQKSLGVYHDFACQAIASTTKNSEINATFVWGQARPGNRTRQDPKKTKKNKKKPLDLVLTTLMKCPPNYTNQIIIKPQCGFF